MPVGLWEDHKDKFYKNQEKGAELILLPWQTVIDVNKASEHSKIRMCLDGNESNKLLHKVDVKLLPSVYYI